MAFKLVYVEDLDPQSIVSDLRNYGFEVEHVNPGSFESVLMSTSADGISALLLDFRLTQGSGNAIYDAPTIAQTLRTKSSADGNYFPIILISSEQNITSFYKDFTSSDLFDLSMSKETFQKNLNRYCVRIEDFIETYRKIRTEKFDFSAILGITGKTHYVDYRFIVKLNDTYFGKNIYRISRIIFNSLLRSIGTLIGEDVLAARLGVDKNSTDWNRLREMFESVKYSGVFCQSYNRWWSRGVEEICDQKFKLTNLRRLNAIERTKILKEHNLSDLIPESKAEFSDSSNFWTICKDLKIAIDPIDGLELVSKENVAWQEPEYISMLAAMKTSDYLKDVKPSEIERFKEFSKSLKK